MAAPLHRPCGNCPFRREGGVRLRQDRIRELCKMLRDPAGGDFTCHKTSSLDWDQQQMCAGSAIFSIKNGNLTQMQRIAMRLGLLEPDKLTDQDAIFDTTREMLAASKGKA